MEWTVALIPSAFATGEDPADSAWRALTEDSRPIECIVWGKATPAAPMRLLVRVGGTGAGPLALASLLLPAEDGPREPLNPPRLPAFEEVLDAADSISPAGAIFHLGMYTSGSRGEGAPMAHFSPEAEWGGMWLQQVGTAEGSPAARGSLILSHGGGNAN